MGLSESAVRKCVRDGLLDARVDRWPLRFSFQDLKVLKLLKGLTQQGVSGRRARRQLCMLRARVARGSLSSLAIDAHNGHVVVRSDGQVWRADSGQMIFGFQFPEQDGVVTEIPACQKPEPETLPYQTADEWFEQAFACEESDPARAMKAYEQALKQRPDCTESLINLGRLHAEAGNIDQAGLCFRLALDIEPQEATALYNLGVIAQDVGKDNEAIDYYELALGFDGEIAEAHYNLATIFDRAGDARAAIRHINEYRKLVKRRR